LNRSSTHRRLRADYTAHAFREPCSVTADADSLPVSFVWRKREYTVEAVFEIWHLRDRWWVPRVSELLHDIIGPSDGWYFRFQCAGLAFYDLYHDIEVGIWLIDRVLD
jgi:hypothetical protein